MGLRRRAAALRMLHDPSLRGIHTYAIAKPVSTLLGRRTAPVRAALGVVVLAAMVGGASQWWLAAPSISILGSALAYVHTQEAWLDPMARSRFPLARWVGRHLQAVSWRGAFSVPGLLEGIGQVAMLAAVGRPDGPAAGRPGPLVLAVCAALACSALGITQLLLDSSNYIDTGVATPARVTVASRAALPLVTAAVYAVLLLPARATVSTVPFLAAGMLIIYVVVVLYEWLLRWARIARRPAIADVSALHAAVVHRSLSNPLHALQNLARDRPAMSVDARLAELRALLDLCIGEIETNRAEPATVQSVAAALPDALMLEDPSRLRLRQWPQGILSSGDTQLLRCVLADLSCNALKAVRNDGVPTTVAVDVRRQVLDASRELLVVDVVDDGPGMGDSVWTGSLMRLDRILATFGGGIVSAVSATGGVHATARWVAADSMGRGSQ